MPSHKKYGMKKKTTSKKYGLTSKGLINTAKAVPAFVIALPKKVVNAPGIKKVVDIMKGIPEQIGQTQIIRKPVKKAVGTKKGMGEMFKTQNKRHPKPMDRTRKAVKNQTNAIAKIF